MRFVVLRKKKLIAMISVVIAVLIVIPCAVMGVTVSVFSKTKSRKLPVYAVDTDEKAVAISFDCAWGVDYTDKLLGIMKEEDVVCTFFCVEFWTKKYPEYVKKISEHGHEIGTHSATHPHMSKLSEKDVEKELTTSSQAIEEITGKKVEVFRPPYGEYNDAVLGVAERLGLYSIQWDVDSLDWKNLGASEITDRVLKKVKNGSIVLFHNQGLHTSEALPLIIKGLKSRGYAFKRIGDLIYRNDYIIKADGRQTKNK